MAERVISYDFRGNFTNLTAGLATAGASVNAFGTKLTALDKNGVKMRAGLTAIGGAAGKVGLAAAAGLGAVVLVSARFDKAMSNVAATGQDARDSLDELRQAALDAGAATSFSASEAASGVENLLKAGISAKDVLGGGLSGALDLAAAGGLEVAAAAEIAATAMTQFSLSGQDVGHVADLLAAGAGKAQGDVSDMGMALKQSGLVASQVGLTIEETTGTLAAFASAGLIGSDAGTSFKTMLQSLTPTGDKAADAMRDLGITAYDAQGNFVGMTEFAASLQNGLKDLSVEQQNAAMKTIFGSDAVRAAAVIFEQGASGVQSWIDKVDDSGYAAETAGVKLDNLAGDWEALTGSLETALIGSGEGSTGILREMVQGATDLINAFNDLSPAAKNVTSGLLAITAITGGAAWFGAKVIGGIAATNAALQGLGVQARITAASIRSVALGAGITVFATGYISDSNSIVDSMKRSKAAADEQATSIQDLADTLTASNVGKYAAELGIDVQRLAEDLYTNGESGEYASRVLDQLAESSSGFGAMLNAQAGAILPFYTANADKAYDANKDLKASIEGLTEAQRSQADLSNLLLGPMGELPNAADDAAGASDGLAGATEGVAKAAAFSKKEIRGLVDAMRSQRDAALAAFDAETQYREALKAARAQGKKNEAGIRGSSEAALNNRNALSQLAAAWNNQSAAVKNNSAKFRESRAAFIETATSMGVPRKAAERLAAQILDIPKSRAVKIAAETAVANAAIEETRRRLAYINGYVATTYVRTIRQTIGTGVGPAYRADGGQVLGPGTSTSDSIPAYLSNREYVIKAAAVDHYGVGFFDKANAMRLANGGYAGERTARGDGDGVDGINLTTASLRALSRALRESEKAVDKESRQRDALISKRDDLASGIRGGLGGDIWAGASNPWAAGATANPTDVLKQQTAQAREFIKLIRSLKSKGLDGGALAEVIGSGDIERARMMAALSAKDLRGFEQAFNTNARVLQMAGQAGGGATYNAALAVQTKELQGARAELKAIRLELKSREKADDRSRQRAADRAADRQRRGAARGVRNRPNGG